MKERKLIIKKSIKIKSRNKILILINLKLILKTIVSLNNKMNKLFVNYQNN